MKFEIPNDRKIIVEHELMGINIYDENKLWLFWNKCPVHIKDGEFISIIKSYNQGSKQFFQTGEVRPEISRSYILLK